MVSKSFFFLFRSNNLDQRKRTKSLFPLVAEISTKQSITILSVIKHMVLIIFWIWSRFDLSPKLRIGTFGLKSFFSFFGATFQARECGMLSIGSRRAKSVLIGILIVLHRSGRKHSERCLARLLADKNTRKLHLRLENDDSAKCHFTVEKKPKGSHPKGKGDPIKPYPLRDVQSA